MGRRQFGVGVPCSADPLLRVGRPEFAQCSSVTGQKGRADRITGGEQRGGYIVQRLWCIAEAVEQQHCSISRRVVRDGTRAEDDAAIANRQAGCHTVDERPRRAAPSPEPGDESRRSGDQ